MNRLLLLPLILCVVQAKPTPQRRALEMTVQAWQELKADYPTVKMTDASASPRRVTPPSDHRPRVSVVILVRFKLQNGTEFSEACEFIAAKAPADPLPKNLESSLKAFLLNHLRMIAKTPPASDELWADMPAAYWDDEHKFGDKP